MNNQIFKAVGTLLVVLYMTGCQTDDAGQSKETLDSSTFSASVIESSLAEFRYQYDLSNGVGHSGMENSNFRISSKPDKATEQFRVQMKSLNPKTALSYYEKHTRDALRRVDNQNAKQLVSAQIEAVTLLRNLLAGELTTAASKDAISQLTQFLVSSGVREPKLIAEALQIIKAYDTERTQILINAYRPTLDMLIARKVSHNELANLSYEDFIKGYGTNMDFDDGGAKERHQRFMWEVYTLWGKFLYNRSLQAEEVQLTLAQL